jgi:hypothetical protein
VLGETEEPTVSVVVSIAQECAWGDRRFYCECVSVVVSIEQECPWGDKRSTMHMDHLENLKSFMSSANQTPEPFCVGRSLLSFLCHTILVQCQSY